MKKTNNFIYNWLLIITFIISITTSCTNDEWDSHYKQLDSKLDINIIELLSEDQNYSNFLELIEKTGYTEVLDGSQTHTVWAPNNEALAQVSEVILNDSLLLKAFVENHISKSSYNTTRIDTTILVNMFNEKFIQFSNINGGFTFGGVDVVEQDLLTNNGIVHKIDKILDVKPNIWEYLNDNEDRFPILMSYFKEFNEVIFDEGNSVRIGFNESGESVYDSVFSASNSFFETIGNINLESDRSTFIGLTDDVYNNVYNDFKEFYKHPIEDSTLNATNDVIFKNLNFTEVPTSELNGSTSIFSTNNSSLVLNNNSIDEDISLSNGNILVVNDLNYEPENIFYKDIRYEIENTERRFISSTEDLSIASFFDFFSSGSFLNVVSLLDNPSATNNYFEIKFSNVLSAAYDLNIKFSAVGVSKRTKLDFILYYNDPFNDSLEVNRINDIIVDNTKDTIVKLGGPYEIPAYIDNNIDNTNSITLRISVDVSEAELILYDRQFGIDYVELTPSSSEPVEE